MKAFSFPCVLIPIETSSRELLYKTYLALLLADSGVPVFLGEKKSINFLCRLMENYLYLDKGYHKDNSEEIWRNIRAHNGKILSLDEEGAVDLSSGEVLRSRYSSVLLSKVDKVCLWGFSQLNYFSGIDQDLIRKKLIVTGHPRFQLLHSSYRDLYRAEVEKIKGRHLKMILIATNMGFGSNRLGDSFVRRNYGGRISELEKLIEFDKNKISLISGFVRRLSETYPAYTIVIRPHPEESLDPYNCFLGSNNIIISREYSVVPWIIACSAMIHTDCTTGVEAAFLGRKPISLLPVVADDAVVAELPLQFSHQTNDIDAALALVSLEIKERDHHSLDIADEFLDLSKRYFSYGADSFKTIRNEILRLVPVNSQRISYKTYTFYYRFLIKIFQTWITFKNLNSGRSRPNPLLLQKLDGLDYKSVRAIKKNILTHCDFSESLSVDIIQNDLYFFYKKNVR